jgi:excisionase family DNA binding protein
MSISNELLCVDEAAEYLRISPHTLRAWVAQGKLPYVKLVGRVLFRMEDLKAFVNSSLIKPSEMDQQEA